MTGFLRSIGFIADEPAHVRAVTVEAPAAYRDATANEVTPCASGSHSGDGSDAEPEHLRRKRERVQRAEVERDSALAEYTLALARYRDHRPTWAVD